MEHIRLSGKDILVILMTLFLGTSGAAVNIIPKPNSLTLGTGTFTVPATVILYSDGQFSDSTLFWVKQLFLKAGKVVKHSASADAPIYSHIRIRRVSAGSQFDSEGYSLIVKKDSIQIAAPTSAGQFYAVQTLRQMLPPQVERGPALVPATITLDEVTIIDKPRFARRGLMLDPVRHFIDLNYIRETIDRIASFKMNIFHMHLCDDQGWRWEVNGYPELTAKGASTQCGGGAPPSGTRWYFTQQELKDIVVYAAQRKIGVVPEIEMPGHCQAAIACYPSLGTSGSWDHNNVYTGTDVGQSLMDINNGATQLVKTFCQAVLTQAAAIFPGPYLDIGADECYNSTPAGYQNFVREMETFINGLGKKALGWEETYGKFANSTSISQIWNSAKDQPGTIFSWCNHFYLDQGNRKGDPSAHFWCAANGTSIQDVFNAYPSLPNHIGVEATLFTEFADPAKGYPDRQLFPRLTAVSELGWTNVNNLSWNDFAARVAPFGGRFNMMGMTWYTAENLVTWQTTGCPTYPNDTSVYSDMLWSDVPVDTILISGIALIDQKNTRRGVAAGFKLYDMRGRLVSGKTAQLQSKSMNGIFFRVDDTRATIVKVLKIR